MKDVSSLISMAINLARQADATVNSSLSKEDLDAWLLFYELAPLIEKLKKETKPEKVDASIKRALKSRTPLLIAAYEKYYPTGAHG